MPTLLDNKKTLRDFEIIERYEAGIELLGGEVKSLRGGHGKLTGSHVIMRGGEAYLIGMSLPLYQPHNLASSFEPERTRRLLLTRSELATLSGAASKKGQTIIPISIYTKGKKIKVEIALARGKKKYDQRQDIKKREDLRHMRRAMKGGN